MPQLDQVSACPGCGEPLEEDDRFCGVCGTARHAMAGMARAEGSGGPVVDDPTVAVRTPTQPDQPLRTPTEPDFTLPPPQPPAAPPSPGPSGAWEGPPSPPPLQPPVAGPLPSFDPRTPPAAPPPPPAPPAPPQPPVQQSGDPRAATPEPEPEPPAAPGQDPRTRDARPPSRETHPVSCAVCGNGYVDRDGYCEECGRAQPGERDHVERALGGVAAVSDLGLRHHRNEDAFTVSATALPDGSPAVIAVVCDGVSSSSRPDEASAAAAEAAQEYLLHALPRGVSGQQAMHDALLSAARAVAGIADETERAPGRNAPACTIVSAVTASGTLTVGWIGDSRAYWVPIGGDGGPGAGAPARLTEDDSWAAQMVAAGLLTEAEAMADHRAHAITAWLGADAQEIEPHTASFKPDRPGVVLVCTDGLWNYAESADEMARLVPAEAHTAPLASARHLVQHALDSGGHDNVTVAVIPFPVATDRAGTA